ncbi:COP9 signalosome-like protein complex subunit 1 [Hortaea werneckii]|nr:COP9 signalosome-like protein complex subunit 1 [Hortaea werneckii]
MAANGSPGSPAKRMRPDRSPAPGALPPPTFDLETWASNYEGALLPLRLAHIAIHCPALSHQSMTTAVSAAKKGKDVQLYTGLCELAKQLGHSDLATPDAEWVTKQEEGNRRETSRLEGELRGYKNNLIRESIRMGQEDIATHMLVTGGPAPDPNNPQSLNTAGYNAAYQAFGKMRDYCTTPTHIASMTLRLIYTSLLQAVHAQQQGLTATTHFNATLANAGRLRTVGVKEEEQSKLTPISSATTGIAQLGLGNYRDAAGAFLNTSFDYHTQGTLHGADFTRALASANDLAIYGGLTALATFSRQELLDKVLGGNFRPFLELEPHMRKAISLYTTAKYQACLDTLRRYYSDWRLDIFLGAPSTAFPSSTGAGMPESHVDALFARIREKSITAHFTSFSEISLASLASTFPPTSSSPTAMEDEILQMIESGQLDARLDVVNGLLIAPPVERRTNAHAEAQRTAAEVERTLLLRLHRVNATLGGLEIPRPKGQPAWGEVGGAGYGA